MSQGAFGDRKREAFELARQNRPRQALALYRKLYDEAPDDPEVLGGMAVLSNRLRQFVQAEAFARRQLGLQPKGGGHVALATALRGQGRLEQAASCLKDALQVQPDAAGLWAQLGSVLSEAGQRAEAGRCLERAVELDAGHAEAWHDFAVWLQSAGDTQRAIEGFRRAVSLRPGSARFLNSLGSALYLARRLEEAASCFRRALKILPNYLAALINLANANYDQCEYARAIVRYRQVLEIAPDHEEARLGLAMACEFSGRPLEALEAWRSVLEKEPGNPEYHARFGELCIELGRHEEAIDAFRTTLLLAPENPAPGLRIGVALEHLGRMEEALAQYEQVRREGFEDPGQLDILCASAYEKLGDFECAWRSLEPALADKPVPRALVTAARLCHRLGHCEQVAGLLEQALDDPRLQEPDRRALCFALGSVQDRLGNHEAAFRAYSTGNRLRNLAYSEDHDAAFVRELTKVFGSDALRRLAGSGSASRTPLFIVGMPRSGTSLVEQILASHPQVAGGGELLAIGKLVESLPGHVADGASYPQAVRGLDPLALEEMAQAYLAELQAVAPGAQHVTDKMPHNFAYIGLIHLMFPEARIVHCVRDPVDTCLSCYFQDFSGFHNYAYRLTDLGAHYGHYVQIMRFWEEDLGIQMLNMHYEQLVEEPESRIRDLLAYCGLEWDEACMRFHESGRTIRTASYNQVRTPLYASSAGRWKNYREHLGELLDALEANGVRVCR